MVNFGWIHTLILRVGTKFYQVETAHERVGTDVLLLGIDVFNAEKLL
jgi:hypothetical protein